MSQTIHHRLHILEAADWKDGVITLLNPDSPYRPWRYAFGEARPGDYAMLVLGTDPVSVVTVLARIGDEGGLDGSMLDLRRYRADLVDLATLAMVLDLPDAFTSWRLDDDDAERVILALHESRVYGKPFRRCSAVSATTPCAMAGSPASSSTCSRSIRNVRVVEPDVPNGSGTECRTIRTRGVRGSTSAVAAVSPKSGTATSATSDGYDRWV